IRPSCSAGRATIRCGAWSSSVTAGSRGRARAGGRKGGGGGGGKGRRGRGGGRDPATLSITVVNAPADAAALAPYREAGIARVLLEVPDLSRDDILRRLDKLAPFAAENRGLGQAPAPSALGAPC